MTFRGLLLLSFASLPCCSIASAQTNSFLLFKSGKQIGHASYAFDKVKEGERVRSKFEYRVSMTAPAGPDADAGGGGRKGGSAAAGGSFTLEGQLTFEYRINGDGDYLGGYLQDTGTQLLTSFTPTKTRDAVTEGKVQAGLSGTTENIPMPKPSFIVTPAFDPSVVQVLLNTVRHHPHPDHVYVILDPGVGGRGVGAPAYLAVGDAIAGTGEFDGKAIALQIYPVRWQKSSGWIYADADGNVMQADIGPLSASYIRVKFKTTGPPPVYKPKQAANPDAKPVVGPGF